MKTITAIIPVRAGSTRLKNKNVAIRTLNIEIVNDAANPLSPHPQ